MKRLTQAGAILWITPALFGIACTGSGPDSENDTGQEERPTSRQIVALKRQSTETSFDMGTVIANNRIYKHVFTLTNCSSSPLKIVGAESLSPCCASIDDLSGEVKQYQYISFPVEFKTGFTEGPKSAGFAVETLSPDRQVRLYTISANLISSREFKLMSSAGSSLDIGESGRMEYRIACRSLKGEGLEAPQSIVAEEPLKADFAGEVLERQLDNGVTEQSRMINVSIPPSDRPGHHQGTLRLIWADGAEETFGVGWEVCHSIEVEPSAIIAKRHGSELNRHIYIRSKDDSFRIISVSCQLVDSVATALPTKLSKQHRVDLQIGPPDGGHRADAITILTDHRKEGTVSVPILWID